MKLTNEETARVFIMYWGCEIHQDGGLPIPNDLHFLSRHNFDSNDSKLLLTPLSKISDEDAIEVAKIVLSKDFTPIEIKNWDWCIRVIVKREPDDLDHTTTIEMEVVVHFEKCDIQWIWNYINQRGIGTSKQHCPNSFQAYQYLISKGYAIPLYFGVGHWANNKTAIELEIAIDRTEQ